LKFVVVVVVVVVFFTDRIRFCFYGANPPVINVANNFLSSFHSQIFYSLLPNSPSYLYINPYDGCVKLAPTFNINENELKSIQYSVK
jgi:hypothetical protein